jgi:hypothetical protein
MRWLLLSAFATTSLAACRSATGPVNRPQEATGEPQAATPAETPAQTPAEAPTSGVGSEAVALAVSRALATQRGISPSDVKVLSVEAVVWPDSSLGCPEPGQMYLQVLTPGYRVAAEVAGERLEAHTDRATPPHVVTCAHPGPPVAEGSR